jgi:succinate dehydrogenase / fumarate reductase membrane anchor subunit
MAERPIVLSPFLNYRWQYTNTLSLLHRLTGLAPSLAFIALLYWINALSRGPSTYASAAALNAVLLVVLILVVAYHSNLGIRVIVEDYVHHAFARTASLILIQFRVLLAAVGVHDVLKVALGATA